MVEMSSLVLFAADADATVAFYRALGLPLEEEDHGEGPVHFAAEIGDVHFAVHQGEYAAQGTAPWRAAGSVFAGLYVDSLDEVVASVNALGARILTEHQVCPWGCRIVTEDPDARAIEINQRAHCPQEESS